MLRLFMSKAIKAALLSAFVFPGTGHFFLKKYTTGTLLAVAAFTSLYVVVSGIVEKALQIVEKIQLGEVQLDVAAIAELLSKQPTGSDAQLFSIAWTVFLISWFISIVDSYRIGCKQDKNYISGD
jgi:hypothetical protein